MARPAWFSAVLLVGAAVVSGCGPSRLSPHASTPVAGSATPTAASSVATPVSPTPTVVPPDGFAFDAPEVMATGLEVPWAIGFLPDGAVLVTERETGRVLRLVPGVPPVEVARIEDALAGGEGGLLGLAVSPAYERDGLVYVMYSTQAESRIARFRLGEPPEVILDGIPGNPFHTGGHIAFGPDGMLYAAVGDATIAEAAQDPTRLVGKILRLESEGSVPADNPIPGSPVWSLGHRNVEGFAWDDAGRMWATEFGASALDELNRIEPGRNYGWPIVEGPGGEPDFVDPLVTWTPAEASPAGVAFAGGRFYVAALRGERLWRVPLGPDGGPGPPEAILERQFGRLRAVALAPDGSLWIATSNRDGRGEAGPDDDRIVRFAPVRDGG
jgi:glucose/arabinose dehydrogenase